MKIAVDWNGNKYEDDVLQFPRIGDVLPDREGYPSLVVANVCVVTCEGVSGRIIHVAAIEANSGMFFECGGGGGPNSPVHGLIAGAGSGSASRPDGRVRGGAGGGSIPRLDPAGGIPDGYYYGMIGRRVAAMSDPSSVETVSLSESDRHRQQQERSAESAQHHEMTSVQQWCDENGWTEPQLIDGRWWAFQGDNVMPTPVRWAPPLQISEDEFWRRLEVVLDMLMEEPLLDFQVVRDGEDQNRTGCVSVMLSDRQMVEISYSLRHLDIALRYGQWRRGMVNMALDFHQAIEAKRSR